ncbi:Carotenogenesis protein CarS [Myxococcus sp. CA056]|uniref:Carotenogenesis protein CarS n=1 Tax=unclassified Myxococcus TaxID=2648731 RepID=UPI00157B7AEC|nr:MULTISPECIES: Carotenogenesis protein CarS [unclassified Myxococcus]NTX17577.1 Carotenogenesis protein CarS [Myxococcus sp. CA056]NTX37055.1 Carotenogenesis protein CarS [Myxococcus sp. CA033]NTX57889.1 Carotenogenesis protein CarS [Myxococcus sp. CA039A]
MTLDPSLIVSTDVDGAPVRIGEPVTVISASSDGTISPGFLGRTGTVVALVYDDPGLQYPSDPLIQVRVDGLGEDLFFPDELEPQWALQRAARQRREDRERAVPGTHRVQ